MIESQDNNDLEKLKELQIKETQQRIEELKAELNGVQQIPIVSFPTYISDIEYPEHYNCLCGMKSSEPKYKRDCYFYREEMDMGAIISYCSFSDDYIRNVQCPCNACPDYISKERVDKLVRNYLAQKEGEDK